MNIQDFRKRMLARKNSSSFVNWKEDGSLVFVVHPKADIGERKLIRYEREVTNEDGQTDIWGCYRPFVGQDDFSVVFKNWLKAEASIDNDDVVFRLSSTNRGVREYTKGDLIGLSEDKEKQKKYSWKKNMLKPKEEFLLCVRAYKEWQNGWQVLTITPYTGEKWWAVVESQIQEFGEVEGSYQTNPYVFKITFDDSQPALGKYSIERIAHKLSAEQLRDLEEPPLDILAICDPNNYDTSEGGTVQDLIRNMLVVPCPLFKNVAREIPGSAITESSNITDSQSMSSFVCGVKYFYDDEEVTFVKATDEFCVFVDSDNLKVKVPTSKVGEVLPFEQIKNINEVEAFHEETVKVDTGTQVKDCVVGREYYTLEGEVLVFVRYQVSKNQGVFRTQNEERVIISGDAYVSPGYTPPEDDPLAPIDSKSSYNENPTTETGNASNAPTDGCVCGVCGMSVPDEATVCPNCGTLFSVDEADLPDFGIE